MLTAERCQVRACAVLRASMQPSADMQGQASALLRTVMRTLVQRPPVTDADAVLLPCRPWPWRR